MLAAAERWGGGADERPFLPRAFSVLRRHDDGRLDFLFEDVGPGTRRLCELRAGDGLWLLGPLGVGFRAPEDERRPLLVGGGVGIAPLAIWQDVLGAPALLGFRDARHAEGARLLDDPRVATDDGSVGFHGLVTELLREEIDSRLPGLRVRAAADARGGARAVRGGGRAGPARAGVGDGVRVRRVLRVRGADARAATCGCASTVRCSTRATWSSWRDRPLRHPAGASRSSTRRGRSTRSPRGARSVTRCSRASRSPPSSPRPSPSSRARATRRRGCGSCRPG